MQEVEQTRAMAVEEKAALGGAMAAPFFQASFKDSCQGFRTTRLSEFLCSISSSTKNYGQIFKISSKVLQNKHCH